MTAYHDEHENEYDLRAAAADWLAECARYFDAQAAHTKEDSEHWAGVKNAEIARRIVNLIAPDGVAPCGYCATKTPGEGTAIVFKAVEPYLLPLANHDAVATAIASAMAGSVVVPDDRLRASSAPDRVSVKPLEWAHGGGPMGERGWRLVAHPPIGSIYVIEVIIHGQRGRRWTLVGDREDYATADEAKAAAQADYEKRILSALSEASKPGNTIAMPAPKVRCSLCSGSGLLIVAGYTVGTSSRAEPCPACHGDGMVAEASK